MVFFEEFDEFMRKSQELYDSDPVHSRYTIKFRNIDQRAILKVTNNVKSYQYKCEDDDSHSLIDKFNAAIFCIAANSDFDKQLAAGKKKKGKKGKGKKGKK